MIQTKLTILFICEREDHFDSKQSRESVDLLITCHPFPSLIVMGFFGTYDKKPITKREIDI